MTKKVYILETWDDNNNEFEIGSVFADKRHAIKALKERMIGEDEFYDYPPEHVAEGYVSYLEVPDSGCVTARIQWRVIQ